jgi:hypothetical protein
MCSRLNIDFVRKMLAAMLAAAVLPVAAQVTPPPQARDNVYNYMQLLNSETNTAKVELINKVMGLSEADAKTFWSIYREYEVEAAKQNVSKTEFVAEYIRQHRGERPEPAVSNARASDMARRWFGGERARLDLLEKYFGRMEKELSAFRAAQFLQIEYELNLFLDVTIAREVPLVSERIK